VKNTPNNLLPRTLFSLAINFFPQMCLLNSFIIYLVSLALLPLLPKFLSQSIVHLSSASICYMYFNFQPLWILIAALTFEIINIDIERMTVFHNYNLFQMLVLLIFYYSFTSSLERIIIGLALWKLFKPEMTMRPDEAR